MNNIIKKKRKKAGYVARNVRCWNCNSGNVKHVTGHLNIIINKDTFVTIFCSTCDSCYKKKSSTANPLGHLKSGYYGDWHPRMGITELQTNCKYYNDIMDKIYKYKDSRPDNKLNLVNL